jgi:hypothetical protein
VVRNIWRVAPLAAALFYSGSSLADEYAGGLTVARVRVHSTKLAFGTTSQPANTCNEYGEYFRFDPTTTSGKNWMAIVVTAKTTGKPIDVWYKASTAPGTDSNSGCSDSTNSVLTGIALSKE